jgi:hypothetical protein
LIRRGLGGDPVEESFEVVTVESPVEGPCGVVVASLEGGELFGQLLGTGDVVRCEQLALDDREVDLDLVQPGACTGVWTMTAFGKASRGRAAAVQPRWEDPLSTTQNTRRAVA